MYSPKDRSVPHCGGRGGEQPSRGNAWWGYAIRGEGHRLKNLLGRYARWKGSPGTLKSWLTQTAGVGRRPLGERGLLRPTGRIPYLQERIGHRLARDQETLT